MSGLDTIHVVVPARDEEELVGRCLDALSRSREALRAARPELEVRITVVLDRCVDGTAGIVRGARGVEAIEVAVLSVGAARAAGVQHAAGVVRPEQADRVWVACTDADSMVPVAWLTGQARAAEQGYAARIGTVLPDLEITEPLLHQRWLDRHDLGPGHPHVHGANLGVRLTAYREVGGFTHRDCGEDVHLVRRLRRAGLSALVTGDDPVTTSGRRVSRVQGGFADYLSELTVEAAP